MIPLVVNPLGLQIYTQAKTSWFLLFSALSIGALALTIFCQKKIKIDYHKYLTFFFLFWIISLFISTSLANNLTSIFGAYSNPQGLIFYLLIFVHFFFCLHLLNSKKAISVFFNITKIIAALICLHAVGQYFNIDPFVDVDNKRYLFRVYGTIGQPNFLGQFLIFPFFILLFQIKEFLNQKKYQSLAINTALFLLITVVIYLTKNRATWLAIFFSLYIWFIIFSGFKKTLKISASLVGILSATALLYLSEISMRSINSRAILWDGTLKILDWGNALFGNGLESFYQSFAKIMPKEVFLYEEFYTFPQSPHNEFLATLTERGLFGVVLYLLPIVFLGYLLIKGKIQNSTQKITFFAILSYLISVQFSFSTIEHWVFLAGFWAILLRQTLKFRSKIFYFKKFTARFIIVIILAIVSITNLLFSFATLRTDLLLRRGINEYVENAMLSRRAFRSAISALPFFSYPREIFISLFISSISIDKQFSKNIEKQLEYFGVITDQDFNYHIMSMRFAAEMNNPKKFAEHFEQAVRKAPNLPLVYTEAGNINFERGDCLAAVNSYEKLLLLAPPKYIKNKENCEQINECRIFKNNAFAFFEAMENMEKCKSLER